MARKILEMGGEMKREGGEVWERKLLSRRKLFPSREREEFAG